MLEVDRNTGSSLRDNVVDLTWFASVIVAYFFVDLTTSWLADYGPADADGSVLALDAVVANPIVAGLLVVAVVAALVRRPERECFLGRWSSVEHGPELRLLAAPLILLLVWQGALQAYDFHLDQSNLVDRALLVGLGLGALARPALLLGFVAQQRILAAPLAFPFGSIPGQNIDDLLVIVLAALAGAHLIAAIAGRSDISPVVAVIVAAVAAHFFVPGFAKVRSGWFFDEDLRFLAPNAYAVGWLGQTDGGLSAELSRLLGSLGPPMRLVTIVFELGSALCAAHHRLFRWWLIPAITFHVVNFVILGYWFLGWILVEVGLIVFLRRATVGEWLDRSLTPARAAATLAIVVVAGTTLFHPPRLSWYDSPVADGYRIEAVGESGATYHVPFGALAPFEQDLAFTALTLGTEGSVTGPYGVVGGAERVDELRRLASIDGVDALRKPLTDDQLAARDRSEEFLADWVERANQRAGGDGPAIDLVWSLRAPVWFWTGRAEPVYAFDEPIRRLQVDRLTSLTTGDEILRRSSTVLVLEVGDGDGDGGTATVTSRG